MTEADLRVVKGLNSVVRCHAGNKIGDEIMEGSELLSPSSQCHEFSEWVKGAMIRLDELVDENTRDHIMRDCGRLCSLEYKEIIQSAKERYQKSANLDEFLANEVENRFPGMSLERDGNVLYQVYDPGSFENPQRCYCTILRGLPPDETISVTYCHCSSGFIKSYWEQVLRMEVRVDILESVVSGGRKCRFAIHLLGV